jgi:hypothetical protein
MSQSLMMTVMQLMMLPQGRFPDASETAATLLKLRTSLTTRFHRPVSPSLHLPPQTLAGPSMGSSKVFIDLMVDDEAALHCSCCLLQPIAAADATPTVLSESLLPDIIACN